MSRLRLANARRVFATGCAADHLHSLLRLAPRVALADAVQRLKGGSAFEINAKHLLSERLVWQAGYWAESFGPADVNPLLDYVRKQRTRHDDSHKVHPISCAF